MTILIKKQKKTLEEYSKNHGRSVRYLRRKQYEKEAKEIHEDGLKQLNKDENFRNYLLG